MTDEHDRFVTISYFVREMLGLRGREWYYRHINDEGMPQRIIVGGKPKLSLRDCIAYQDLLKRKRAADEPPVPPKRKRGRPRKIRLPAPASPGA